MPKAKVVGVGRSLLNYRKREVATLVFVGLLLGATVCGLSSLRLSALNAQERAVRADQAGAAFAVQAGGSEARAALADVPKLIRVGDTSGSVSLGPATIPVAVRLVNEPGQAIGRIIDGHAAGAGEVTLSLGVVQALAAELGDQIAVSPDGRRAQRSELVGITVNEVDRDDATAVIVDVHLEVDDTDVWLSHSDPYLETSLTEMMDERSMTYRPVDSLAEQAGNDLPPGLTSLDYAPIGAALVLGILLIGMLAAMAPVARADAMALVQASMPPRAAWGLIVQAALAAIVLGLVAGFTLASSSIWLGRHRVSGVIGHRWEDIEPAWWALLGLLVTTVIAAVVTMTVIRRRLQSPARTSTALRGGAGWRPAAGVAGCGLLFLVGVSVQKATSESSSIAAYAPVAVIMVVGAMPWMLGSIVTFRLPPASAAVVRQLNANILVAASLAGIVAAGTAGSAARTVHNANVAENMSRAPQPPGSFLVYEVPDKAATLLSQKYLSLGGRDIEQFRLPDEANLRLRVTSTRLIECMLKAKTLNPDTVPDSCFPQETLAPVNTVVLAMDGDETSRSDPGLADHGAVGLLEYVALTPEAASIDRTEARPDSKLGGNMPGLVVSPDSQLSRRYDLRSGGRQLVALLDFESLSRRDKAVMRGLIYRLAPGAQISDAADKTTYDRDRARGAATVAMGAALVLLSVLGGGFALLAGQRRTLRTLVEVGAVRRFRFGLLLRVASVPALTFVIVLPVSAWGTSLSGFPEPGSWGGMWVLPIAAGIIAAAVFGVLLIRVPPRIGE